MSDMSDLMKSVAKLNQMGAKLPQIKRDRPMVDGRPAADPSRPDYSRPNYGLAPAHGACNGRGCVECGNTGRW